MSELSIVGQSKLSGEVHIQGAKNSAMKHIIIPLISQMTLQLHNIPRIGSVDNLLSLVELFNVKYEWTGKNSLRVSSIDQPENDVTIPANIFYYTSGGIITIPILASRFGCCKISKGQEGDESGGDKIGRSMENIIKALKCFGIEYSEDDENHIYTLINRKPFRYEVIGNSFGASMNAILAALYKDGESTIINPSTEIELLDIIKLLKKIGAQIEVSDGLISVIGTSNYNDAEHTNILDKNDLATWCALSVATRSQLEFVADTSFEKIDLDPLFDLYRKWGVGIHLSGDSLNFDISNLKLKPITMRAGIYPQFHTDWQQLLAPILATIPGQSTIIDEFFPMRTKHMEELAKLGIEYEINELEEKNAWDTNLREVTITGGLDLHANEISATDVRGGASVIIGALIANGRSRITRVEEIDRGYENLVGRLRRVGANIEVVD
jgi:UDP-N-acetylglucosamine 1-carboxyvinyltransferase